MYGGQPAILPSAYFPDQSGSAYMYQVYPIVNSVVPQIGSLAGVYTDQTCIASGVPARLMTCTAPANGNDVHSGRTCCQGRCRAHPVHSPFCQAAALPVAPHWSEKVLLLTADCVDPMAVKLRAIRDTTLLMFQPTHQVITWTAIQYRRDNMH